MIVAAVATIHVGTRPDDIAVNPRRNTIYVTVAGANEVKVISRKTNKVTAAIRVSPSPGSVAVNPRTDTIFMTTYPSHKVAVIRGRTNTVTTTIRAGSGLGEIAVNPKTGKAYVTGSGLAPGRDGLTRRSGLRHAELLFQGRAENIVRETSSTRGKRAERIAEQVTTSGVVRTAAARMFMCTGRQVWPG